MKFKINDLVKIKNNKIGEIIGFLAKQSDGKSFDYGVRVDDEIYGVNEDDLSLYKKASLKKKKMKFCLVIDVEGFISFREKNPMWDKKTLLKNKLLNLIKNFRYKENSLEELCFMLKKYDFPASLMLVGELFKPLANFPNIEWGYHTLNHKPLTLLNQQEILIQVKNIYKSKSFSPPMWLVEDIKTPQKVFEILKKEGYKKIVYRGKIDGIKPASQIVAGVFKPIKRFGLECIYLSNTFEGNSKKNKLKEILEEIKKMAEKENVVYCLSTHDFTHRNLRNLEFIIREVLKLKNKVDIVKMEDCSK